MLLFTATPAIVPAALLISLNWLVFVYAVVTDRVLHASLGYFLNPLVSIVLGLVASPGALLRHVASEAKKRNMTSLTISPASRNVDAIRSLHAAGYDVVSSIELTMDLDRHTHEWHQDGHELPEGEIGEVRAKGPGIFTGYYDDPGATAESLVDGWLATGDLGKLPWAEPPSPAVTRQSRWRTAVTALRTIAVAVTPLTALLILQPMLELDTSILQWAKVVGIGWAVLYLLIAADPTLREKIETAQSISNLVSSSRKEPERPEHRDQ